MKKRFWRHIALNDVGSTNDYLKEIALGGDKGNLWVTAERQLNGRGRRGRAWISERGNLYASALLVNPSSEGGLSLFPLMCALSLYDALLKCGLPEEKLEIKWPNDLLFEGKKIAGILLESLNVNTNSALITGFGVNLNHAPRETAFPATAAHEAGLILHPPDVFEALHQSFENWLRLWDTGHSGEKIIHTWRRRVKGVGEEITVNLENHSLTGIFTGISADGALKLQLDDNRTISVPTGDVFFTPPKV